jgi:molecular chaperone GrpE
MTDRNLRPDAPRQEGGLATEADNAVAGSEAAEATALAQEIADLKERLLRTLADMENLRKRTERDVTDARLYGISSFARDILTVADNMDRALEALDAELREKADAGVKALLDGVELTERELHKALEKHGVRKFEPQGERFDPHLHQAMYEVADTSVPAGHVLQVIQPGYMIGDRMLRPAMVAVAKGGPRSAAQGGGNPPVAANDAT